MSVAALIVAAYLLGTLPSAVMVARARGVDITSSGSGNPGASNVTRVLGWKAGVLVFVLDAAKGAAAAGAGWLLVGRGVGYACAAAAAIGHMFPVFRRFRGGKGVATVGGALFVLQPVVAAGLAVVWFAISRLTGKASVASLALCVLLPVGEVLVGSPLWEILASLGLGVLVLLKHGSNIKRLIRREELSLGQNG